MSKLNSSLDNKKMFFKLIVAFVLFSSIILNISTVSAELLNPNYAFTTNYYDSFGEPNLFASVIGDPEFERGETVQLKINLVNKGALTGFKYRTSVGTDKFKHLMSLKEIQYESMRTTAFGLEVQLISNSPFIDIEPDTKVQTIESLIPGELPEDPLTFTLTLSNNAPAGMYYLQLPVSYEYQNQVQMTTNDVMRMGITTLDHTVHYTTANKTLVIPIFIQESPRFEIANVSGNLVPGKKQSIEVIYKNTGEKIAYDAIARIVAMQPITVNQPVVRLGTIEPGDSKTVSFEIFADSSAITKTYGLDSEIKYLNDDDEIEISDNLKVSIPLEEAEKKVSAFMLAMAGVIILVIYLIVNTLRNLKKYE
jgi:hypothetical protein